MGEADRSAASLSAYGGEGWSPRNASHREEIGHLWGRCGCNAEWTPLRRVLLHPPGPEISHIPDPNAAQMIAPLDQGRARAQHDSLVLAYRQAGVEVLFVSPELDSGEPVSFPNLMFCADLVFMTPEGAILARPASTIRAGEERLVARCLAMAGIPVVRTLRDRATFEGADGVWVNPKTVFLGRGLRTNAEGVRQVSAVLSEMGVEAIQVDLPFGTMHLMGVLRLLDHDLAVAWHGRLAVSALEELCSLGFQVAFVPDEGEAVKGHALNVVPLNPREILMAAGNPVTQRFYEDLGVTCHPIEVNELLKAAGGIACLSGVIERDLL